MGAFDYVAEEVNDDGDGGLADKMQGITYLIERLARQIRRPASSVEAEEVVRSGERRELIKRLAAKLDTITEQQGSTGKEDEVFRIEVRREMVKIIEKVIELAAAQVDDMFRSRVSFDMLRWIRQLIYEVAFQIVTGRWTRTEEGDVVLLKRESQTAADHEASAKAKLIGELKIVKANLSSAKERCAQLEEENKILRESHEKGDSPEDGDLVERCAQLEEENRILRESHERGDSPEDVRLVADPNSVSPSNSVLQVVSQVPEEGATEREETSTTATLIGAEHSATTEELKQATKFSYFATALAGGGIVSLLIFHLENKSAEPHTLVFKAFNFFILATFAFGLSITLLTICAPSASYQMPIIRGLVYATTGFLALSGVGVCIALMKAMGLLVFAPVIVVMIVACIIVYYKKTVRSGQPLPRWRSE